MSIAALLISGALLGGAISGFITYNVQEIKVILVEKAKLQAEKERDDANTTAQERFLQLQEENKLILEEKADFITSLEKTRNNYAKDTAVLTKQLADVRMYGKSTNKSAGNSKRSGTGSKESTSEAEQDQFSAELDALVKQKAKECDELDEEFQIVWQPWARNLNNIIGKK